MKADTRLLLRYVDREMSAVEAEHFRARLSASPELSRQVREMQQLGVLLRRWSSSVEARADELLEPTLQRVRRAERQRPRHLWFGYGLVVVLLLAVSASTSLEGPAGLRLNQAQASVGAAIERVEAAQRQAQVFVVGSSATPVVWLVDDVQEDEGRSEQDPG